MNSGSKLSTLGLPDLIFPCLLSSTYDFCFRDLSLNPFKFLGLLYLYFLTKLKKKSGSENGVWTNSGNFIVFLVLEKVLKIIWSVLGFLCNKIEDPDLLPTKPDLWGTAWAPIWTSCPVYPLHKQHSTSQRVLAVKA